METTTQSCCSTDKKPGFFARLWQRLDARMKAKAEAGGSSCCCCGGGAETAAGKADKQASGKGKGSSCC